MSKAIDNSTHIASSRKSHWTEWVSYVAACWSLLYGALGLYWFLGGAGFPFGRANDPAAIESILEEVQGKGPALVIMILGFIGALIAFAMSQKWGKGKLRILLLTVAWVFAATLLIVIPDRRVLMAIAYAPLFVVGAPFHWPEISFLQAIPWPVINQFILMLGGGLWAMAAIAYQRRTIDTCVYCGRSQTQLALSPMKSVGPLAKWAVGIAILVPAIYATTRFIWALGIPLGISDQFMREGQAGGLWIAGAWLGVVAIGGCILTLGLVQRWGEIFPRWMIGLAGKRVPPLLAIIPASFVTLIVTSAGMAYVRLSIIHPQNFLEIWTTMGPELLWPIWGLALGTATFAYYLRRRGQCSHCGQL